MNRSFSKSGARPATCSCWARERIPSIRWIGSDYVRGPLEKLARELPGVPLLHFDLRECPLRDNSVDAVLMLNVLEHIDDEARAMHYVQRIFRRVAWP